MSAWLLHLAFATGGGLGAMARHYLSELVSHQFPFSTLIVNVLGSFLLGLSMGALINYQPELAEHWVRLAFGFCGGFTTFSSFAYQTLTLHRERGLVQAGANIGFSLLLCVAAFYLGSQSVG